VLWRRFDGAEEKIAGTNFGKTRTKADLYMDDAHAGVSSAMEHVASTGEQFLVFDIDRDDGGLEVHAEDRRAGGVERELVRHSRLLNI
jgi:hypothetical protein